jgi:hypothetical protein
MVPRLIQGVLNVLRTAKALIGHAQPQLRLTQQLLTFGDYNRTSEGEIRI